MLLIYLAYTEVDPPTFDVTKTYEKADIEMA